ncbi:hypothetical protein PR202_gb13557 [Eleusine coracana subsp. coracana]|uniref:Uncharacterized protein n=1 Tax=Eleusine coracana subsp. coracana TaxID=191504 RepID=A0AAV5EU25_ELECO|nr:hypothetical protein PR202_gb13557 [Eleusine coracana subsp. coracana]
MDPDAVKSTLSNLAFGNVIAAAARDYQKEILANEKAQAASANHDEVDLDELMDDPELEKLHAERIAALKKEAEKREVLKRQGHGEYREITEGDFLGEVTGSEKNSLGIIARIMDKHLKALAPVYVGTKFIKLDAETNPVSNWLQNAPFFVAKLAIKTLPCVILFKYMVSQLTHFYFRKGIAVDRLVGFQDLGNKDDFSTRTLENILKIKGIIDEKKKDDDEGDTSKNRRIRSSTFQDSDSDYCCIAASSQFTEHSPAAATAAAEGFRVNPRAGSWVGLIFNVLHLIDLSSMVAAMVIGRVLQSFHCYLLMPEEQRPQLVTDGSFDL